MNMKSMSRLFLGLLWVVTMLLALFYTFGMASNIYRVRVMVLYVFVLLLTLLTRYRIAYIWFAVITTLCVVYWALQMWVFTSTP